MPASDHAIVIFNVKEFLMKRHQFLRGLIAASLGALAVSAAAQTTPAVDPLYEPVTPAYSPPVVTVQPMPNQRIYYDSSGQYATELEPQSPQFGSGVNNDTNNTGAQGSGGSAGNTRTIR
jgi:hypothetical protein